MKTRYLILAWLMAGAPGTALAVTISYEAAFTTTDRSMWSSDGALQLDETRFIGKTWNETVSKDLLTGSANAVVTPGFNAPNPAYATWLACEGATLGLGNCGAAPPTTVWVPPITADTRTGVEGTASTSGRVGFELGLKADAGSVDADVDYGVQLEIPDNVNVGEMVNLTGSADLMAGALDTTFPTLEAYLSVVAEARATFSGMGCLIGPGCVSGSTSTGTIGGVQEIVSLNQDGEGGLEYFDGDPTLNLILEAALQASGQSLPTGFPATIDASIAEITAYLPNPDADGGLDGTRITATGQDDLLDVLVDVDNIVSLGLTGTPALFGASVGLGALGSVSYDLIDVLIGPTLDLVQSFEFTPSLYVDLEFSQPVDIFGFGTQQTSLANATWEALPSMAFLDGETWITPTFFLGFEDGAGNVVRNAVDLMSQLALDIDGQLDIDLLTATFDFGVFGGFDLGVGSLFSGSMDLFTTPALFSQQFALTGFEALSADPFLIGAGVALTAVPEPQTITLLGIGLLALLVLRRRAPRVRMAHVNNPE